MNKDDVAGLIEELRASVIWDERNVDVARRVERAADALATLSAENEKLRTALRRCFKGETQAVRNERVLEAIENYTRKALGGTDNG